MSPRLLVVLALSLACTGDGADGESSPPVIDRSTPDRLVESLWEYQTWETTREAEEELKAPHPEFEAYASEVTARLRAVASEELKQAGWRKRNRIESVNVESPSRAVVLVSEASPWTETRSERTYLLAHAEDGWVIRDVTQVCWRCNGVGEVEDHDQELADMELGRFDTSPRMTCDVCYGAGRTSAFFEADPQEE